jgi:hypothetical protein
MDRLFGRRLEKFPAIIRLPGISGIMAQTPHEK